MLILQRHYSKVIVRNSTSILWVNLGYSVAAWKVIFWANLPSSLVSNKYAGYLQIVDSAILETKRYFASKPLA